MIVVGSLYLKFVLDDWVRINENIETEGDVFSNIFDMWGCEFWYDSNKIHFTKTLELIGESMTNILYRFGKDYFSCSSNTNLLKKPSSHMPSLWGRILDMYFARHLLSSINDGGQEKTEMPL